MNAMEQNELSCLTKGKIMIKVTSESNSVRTRKQNPQGVSEQAAPRVKGMTWSCRNTHLVASVSPGLLVPSQESSDH